MIAFPTKEMRECLAERYVSCDWALAEYFGKGEGGDKSKVRLMWCDD